MSYRAKLIGECLSVCLSLSLCVGHTSDRCAETTEPIEISFGGHTLVGVGPRRLVLDGGPDPPTGNGHF